MSTQDGSSAGAEPSGPLAGVRVLDMTSVVMGPLATQILADLGADVITIEPRGGDTSRSLDAGSHPELSGVALNLLRNKRNVALDYKTDGGREALLRIAATVDVVITNHRPKVARRARLEYEDFAAVRNDVIYCQAIGYSTASGNADRPAYDDVIQAGAGVADAGRLATGEPNLVPTLLADKVSGMSIVYAVTSALFARERHGRGARIEVPMIDVVTAFMLVEHGAAAISEAVSGAPGYERILNPERRPQVTSDGLVHILPYSKANFDDVFAWGGRPDLVDDPRYATPRDRILNSAFLYQQLRSIVAGRTTQECLDFCRSRDIPADEAATLSALVARLPEEVHPSAGRYRSIPSPVRFDDHRLPVRRPAPLIGQHTAEVLREVGYADHEIDRLLSHSVIAQARKFEGEDVPEAQIGEMETRGW